ncbi:unnamed protein product [Bursaphelenchus okinawaensis]|uniref:Rotamase n=1 Tax=Bursaphelenchus okinawaensis TaxID=465554 RepID=A0A811K816_9BILA|nr:unnamed protein product [Bursaphelenchus okinawaensis]CAG9093695.1 unnamed protein product [Bursaphelenchus okinawaensis]
MMESDLNSEAGTVALRKAKNCWDEANTLFLTEDFRSAMMLFHRCILMARGIYQDCSVALHQNSAAGISHSVSATESIGNSEDTTVPQKLEDHRIKVEDERSEVAKLIADCYIGLARCVLKGRVRTAEDYQRAAQYCDNVIESNPNNTVAFQIKAEALFKAEKYNDALAILQQIPETQDTITLAEECNRALQMKRRQRDELIQANFARQNAPNEPGMNGHALH